MENDSRNWKEIDSRLEALLEEYRAALPDPEPSADFMPRLWQRVEASQGVLISFRRWTQGFVTAAVALCLLMVLYLASPLGQVSPVYTATYLDALASDHSPERLAYSEVVYQPGEGNPR